MKKIEFLIEDLKTNYNSVRTLTDETGLYFPYVCYLDNKGAKYKNQIFFTHPLPADILGWWSLVKSAILFKDIEYGQWGLKIHSAEQAFRLTVNSLEERPHDFKLTDVVLGEFFGDSDLLLVSCEENEEYGNVFIALPIDERKDWIKVANDFSQFLEKYIKAEGRKFWEN